MTYTHQSRRSAPIPPTRELRVTRVLPVDEGRIVAIVGRATRRMMETALGDLTSVIHVECVGEALYLVRQLPTCILLLSPNAIRHNETYSLVRTLAVATHSVAVLDDEPSDPSRLLRLGACGLRRVIDLRHSGGWKDLRRLVDDSADPLAGRIAAIVLHQLLGAAPGTRRFFGRMIYDARRMPTVLALAERLGIVPSTLMSRFHRAHLPSPKTILARTRLVFAKAMLDRQGASVSDVADRLLYSSPQSFGRHIRRMLGISAGEFRRTVSFSQVAEHYVEQMILRHRATYLSFDPFASPRDPLACESADAHTSTLND